MRRLPGILLLTGATLVVIVALLVSGLRLVLPHLDSWRPQLLAKIESTTGVPVDVSQISANWQNFGPTLDVRDINASLKDGGHLKIKRVTLALDVWQSLLHLRWQFRDLTFYQLQFLTNTPISGGDSSQGLEANRFSDLFLRQFDHFDLRDSEVSFITLSGQRAELAIPQLTWLNGRNRHRAEGQVSLSSLNGQHVALLGFMLTLAAGLSWACGNIFNKLIMQHEARPAVMSLVVWSALIPVIPFLLASSILDGPAVMLNSLVDIDMTTILSLVYLAFVATIVGYGIWGSLLGRYETWRVAPLSLLVPVVGLASAAILLDETLSALQLLGAVLIMAGLYINVFGLRVRRTTRVSEKA